MRGFACGSRGRAPGGANGLRAVALLVTVTLLGGSACASRSAGGLVGQLIALTLAEILEMQRDLESAERLADTRRRESEQASARARDRALGVRREPARGGRRGGVERRGCRVGRRAGQVGGNA